LMKFRNETRLLCVLFAYITSYLKVNGTSR
jgi:hypothetical protein